MGNRIQERLSALREQMREKEIDMYLIGSGDFHGSEYVDGYFRSRAWLSGFTGSAGTLLVSQDFAGLWTDGRYFLQAEEQIAHTGIELFKMGNEGVPTVNAFVLNHIKTGECLGFDGRTVNAKDGQYYAKHLREKGATVKGCYDLVDAIWQDRPPVSAEPAWLLDICYAGQSREDKIAAMREKLSEEKAEWLILTGLDDIAWLLNIRGNDVADNPVVLSYVMLGLESLRLYVNEQAFSDKDKEVLTKAGVSFFPYNAIYEDIKPLTKGKKVWYDSASVNYAILEAMPKDAVLLEKMNPTKMAKAVKNAVEIANIRKAHIKDGVAVTKFMYWLKGHMGKEEMSELSVAEKLESFRKAQEGYLEPSFEPISGYGPHGAIVHYTATQESNAAIENHGLLLMDTGAQYMEGTTDITRTFVMGTLTEEERKFFTLVLRGHLNLGGAKFLYGCTGVNLDYLAREPLWQIGMDYNHGTGHGVGYLLNVHEGPNSFRWKKIPNRTEDCVLEEGMVTSNEPGIYVTGKFGIRHEDLIVCMKGEKNEYGQFMYFDTLTLVPFDLDGVDTSLMTEREKQLLNDYHKKVYELIGPRLDEAERVWLKEATRAI